MVDLSHLLRHYNRPGGAYRLAMGYRLASPPVTGVGGHEPGHGVGFPILFFFFFVYSARGASPVDKGPRQALRVVGHSGGGSLCFGLSDEHGLLFRAGRVFSFKDGFHGRSR